MRYVVGGIFSGMCATHDTLEDAKECQGDAGGTVYELGPEVKEPDYSLLVEWARARGHSRGIVDCWAGPTLSSHDRPNDCTCGLADALEAARIR